MKRRPGVELDASTWRCRWAGRRSVVQLEVKRRSGVWQDEKR